MSVRSKITGCTVAKDALEPHTMYFAADDWRLISTLANDANLPVGRLMIKLAKNERQKYRTTT